MNTGAEYKEEDDDESADHAETAAGSTADRGHAPKFTVDRSSYNSKLAAWFASHFADRTDVEVVDLDIPVSTGFSNETVMFTVRWTEDGAAHSDRFVGRIEPADGGMFPIQTPACAVSAELQHRIMAVVAEHSQAPIPPLLPYEADPAVMDRPFFAMGFVEGVIPPDHPRYSQEGFLIDEATPDDRRRMNESGLDAMAAIHQIDWKAAGLDWLDRSGTGNPQLSDQLELYRQYIETELAGRDHPVLMTTLDWLEANDPNDDRVGLSWGDARHGNIIWQDYTAAAVLDWEACALSPTEADVGWWLMFDRMTFDDIGADRMEGFPTREEMIAYYEKVSGNEVRNPHFWEVFAAMRFAAIFIRLGDRLVASGLVPDGMNPAVGNMVTAALSRLLEIDNPTPNKLSF